MDFPGVAMITGAGSGIGRETAILFAKEGCETIAITDISEKGLAETKGLIESITNDASIKSYVCDVSDESAVQKMVDDIVENFGRLDYCANVAGIILLGVQTAKMETSFFDKHHNINLRGLFFCERAQLQQMLKQEPLPTKDSKRAFRGSIVNVSSMAGLTGNGAIPAYTASKHGVIGLSKADGMHYGKDDIRVNAVCPGAVSTPILANSGNAVSQKPLADASTVGNALNRLGDPDELAQAIVWLSSGRASYITATTLACNGGMIGA